MMAKRKAVPKDTPRKTVAEDPLDPFEEYGRSTPPYLLSGLILFDLDHNPRLEVWIAAIHAIDASGGTNTAPLIELLKSSRGESDQGLLRMRDQLLADLLGRYNLGKPRHRARLPAYMMTDADIALASANAVVEELRAGGLSVADSVTRVAEERKMSRSQLADYRDGRRRSIRKKK
jgi:hypothetical protein